MYDNLNVHIIQAEGVVDEFEASRKRSLLVLEESSQIWEQEFGIMMTYLDDFDRIVLGGDPKQLPPMVSKRCTDTKSAIDWALELGGNLKLKIVVLVDQYRMVPHIGKAVSSVFYNNELRHHR